MTTTYKVTIDISNRTADVNYFDAPNMFDHYSGPQERMEAIASILNRAMARMEDTDRHIPLTTSEGWVIEALADSTCITNIIYSTIETVLKEHASLGSITDSNAVELTLRRLGLDIHQTSLDPDVWIDRLFMADNYGGSTTTCIGNLLIENVVSYRYDTPQSQRSAGRAPKEGEKEIGWGCPLVAYRGILTSPCINVDLAEQYHLTAWRLLPIVKEAVHSAETRKRRSWGWETNLKLSVAGCSQNEIQAWWSMHWKREVSPNFWADLCKNTSVMNIEYALEATSNAYLNRIDMNLGSSFPRSMDIVNGLAKAKGITKGKKLPHNKSDFGVPAPKSVSNDGSRTWSF